VGRPVPLGNANGKHPERNISAGPVDWSGKLLHTHFQYQTVSLRLMKPTAKMRALSTAALQARAGGRAAEIAPTIKELQAGLTSLRAIAAGLNAQGIRPRAATAHGPRCRVARVLDRLN